ncbi:pirin family protein [Paenibacillus turpanensis]|uniref:pirin family protein n=1 Tax=Paenibacillus turpanensis TaxID=2689078 RepID=UPI00140CBCB8|nr:pirin family protein [Paenibacillus turpanensis]
MIQVYPASTRRSVDLGWLRSSMSFSFGEYYDPENDRFGPMRVCNDDVVDPGRGFGPHPHSDMEIVSIVLRGQLRHEDSGGNVAVTTFGEIQRMSAGSGIIHTEVNPSETEPVELLQLWFMPEKRGLPPSYEVSRYDPEALSNTLVPVVSGKGVPGAAKVHQDMTLYLSKLEKGKSLTVEIGTERRAFLMTIEGEMALNGETLARRDTARVTGEKQLQLAALENSFIMVIDLP